MPFCPNCKTEYYPGVKVCADCDAALVDRLPPAAAGRDLATEPLQPICEIDSAAEGARIVADLRRCGIDALVQGGQVQVLRGDAARAGAVIEKYLRDDGPAADSGDPAAPPDGVEVTDEDLVAVFEAPDQFMATTVESLLQHEGIAATVQSRQMPMYDGLALMQNPVWGKVLVLARDEQRAKAVVGTFLKAAAELDGAAAAPRCPSCGAALRPAAKFCDQCGAKAGEQ
ncbi:MAG TPA: zinc-ribbon domain-containing protein [Candidatus Edwardsbacteria bacterium]|nr:zinc-ribbon domain-containing protein [Candidatus Edwardsbacteria bacterium]